MTVMVVPAGPDVGEREIDGGGGGACTVNDAVALVAPVDAATV